MQDDHLTAGAWAACAPMCPFNSNTIYTPRCHLLILMTKVTYQPVPTPPLTKKQSIDDKFGQMLG